MPQVWCGNCIYELMNECIILSLLYFVDLALNNIHRWWCYFRNGTPS